MFHQTHAISSLNFRRELIPIPLGQGLIRESSKGTPLACSIVC